LDFGAEGPPEPEINLTQLIDVVLLLLIFFMISTSFVAQPGISIRLPKARTSDMQSGDQTRLTLTATGLVFVGDKKVSWESLPSRLGIERKRNEQGLLVIKADTKVQHGSVVRAMDIAKQEGFGRIAIATRQFSAQAEQSSK